MIDDAERRVLIAAIKQLAEMRAQASSGWTESNQKHLDTLLQKLNKEDR